jgi:hypothetical protein
MRDGCWVALSLVQLRATWTKYHSMYILFSLLGLMVVVMTGVIPHTVPPDWRIRDAILMWPLSALIAGHLLAPLVRCSLPVSQPNLQKKATARQFRCSFMVFSSCCAKSRVSHCMLWRNSGE